MKLMSLAFFTLLVSSGFAFGGGKATVPTHPVPVQQIKPIMQLAASSRVFVFNPRTHRWYAYQNGRLVRSGRASGGASWCSDVKRACRTPRGVFRITRKGGAGCRSSRYPKPHGGARMDYCMFFSKYYAIHGSNNVPRRNVSHGCIRVTPSAARWLNRSFLRYGDRVIVKSY